MQAAHGGNQGDPGKDRVLSPVIRDDIRSWGPTERSPSHPASRVIP